MGLCAPLEGVRAPSLLSSALLLPLLCSLSGFNLWGAPVGPSFPIPLSEEELGISFFYNKDQKKPGF